MTIKELIEKLEEAKELLGDDKTVFVTGLYGAVADDIVVVSDLGNGNCYLETDLCTG